MQFNGYPYKYLCVLIDIPVDIRIRFKTGYGYP